MIYLVVCVVVTGGRGLGDSEGGRSRKGNRGLYGGGMRFDLA